MRRRMVSATLTTPAVRLVLSAAPRVVPVRSQLADRDRRPRVLRQRRPGFPLR